MELVRSTAIPAGFLIEGPPVRDEDGGMDGWRRDVRRPCRYSEARAI